MRGQLEKLVVRVKALAREGQREGGERRTVWCWRQSGFPSGVQRAACSESKPRGAAKKKMTKVTYICRSAKKKVVTYFILFLINFNFIVYRFFFKAFFGRFVTRGVQKHEKNFFPKKSIWAHHKKCGFFSLRFFFFYPRLFCSIFFLSRFWAFRNKGSSKTRVKKIARKSPQLPKKVLAYLRHFFFFFSRPPLSKRRCRCCCRSHLGDRRYL
jgi:hypothetical protein